MSDQKAMRNSGLIGEGEAKEAIAEIEEPTVRIPLSILAQSLVDFYEDDPTRLMGSFDVMFFVDVLRERIDDISGLVRGIIPVEYWFDNYPHPVPVDMSHDESSTGLRQKQAFNYAARHHEARVQAALLGLITRADLKQTLLMPTVKRYEVHGDIPVIPRAPTQPFDFLFMVMAVDYALRPGQPLRLFFEETPSS